MKLDKIIIKNFKSIEYLELNNLYQNNFTNERAFNLLIGLNESGKSSILQSINNIYSSTLNYEKTVNKSNKNNENNNTIVVELYFNIDNKLNELLQKASDEFLKNNNLQSKIFDNIKYAVFYFKLDSSGRIINSINYLNNNSYKNSSDLESIQEAYNNYLYDTVIKNNKSKIIYWHYSDEFLLPSSIDLNTIISKKIKNKPIENIFKLAKLDIYNLGNLQDTSNRKTIGKRLQAAVNKHFKNVWKSFDINIEINIDIETSGLCTCLIEDKDNENTLFEIKDRSDGFKQFASFILSISSEEVTNELKNCIILLDEPEMHLHPSGIQFLRDRLINMSNNNVIICATHSPFMIDRNTPESHILVSKAKGKTTIKRIEKDTPILSDEVMRIAFGLNYWKELLPKYILLVEGKSDKVILDKVLNKINSRDIFIQSCNGSEMPKIYRYATIDKLNLNILYDNDDGGNKIKKQIQQIAQELNIECNNLFSIKDILNSLPDKSEFEDILDNSDIKQYVSNYDENKTFAENTKNMSKDDLEKLKKNISDNYKFDNQEKMNDFIHNLIDRIKK